MNRDNKQELVTEMHERLTRAKAVFLADFRGMSVGKATTLRNELRSASVEYKVFKNTLLDRAAKGTDMECLSPFLTGPTAIAISYDDPVNAAKVLSKFAKDEQPAMEEAIVRAVEAVEAWAREGIEYCMNHFNISN